MARPTKYKARYCQMLIEHMKQGLSFESFAGIIDVNQDTLYEWVKRWPRFSEARKMGQSYSLLFWERMGISGTAGLIKDFNTGGWVFNMKNRFKWRDRQEIEHTGGDGAPLHLPPITLRDLQDAIAQDKFLDLTREVKELPPIQDPFGESNDE